MLTRRVVCMTGTGDDVFVRVRWALTPESVELRCKRELAEPTEFSRLSAVAARQVARMQGLRKCSLDPDGWNRALA